MYRNRLTRSLATLVAAGAITAGVASPALALPIDNVLIDTAKVDFGNSWSQGSPTSPAELDWSNVNGATCVTGNLYMKNADGLKGKIKLEIYDDFPHTGEDPIATTQSSTKTAVGNGLNVFSISPSCINSSGTHAHVVLLDDSGNPGGGLVPTVTATFDE